MVVGEEHVICAYLVDQMCFACAGTAEDLDPFFCCWVLMMVLEEGKEGQGDI